MKPYWIALRPYSLTAAVVPVLIGTACARLLLPDAGVNWLNFILVLIGCILAQCVSNLVNDLAESKTGLDQAEHTGRLNVLQKGLISFRQMMIETLILGAVAAAIGGYFLYKIGGPMWVLVLGGGLLAVEYTAPPLRLKYRALGDVAVLLTFGIGMTLGSYLVQGYLDPSVLSPSKLLILAGYSIPNSFLVVAILHANNHRDRENDREFGAATVANKLSFGSSKTLLVLLIVMPYCLCVGLIGLMFPTLSYAAIIAALPLLSFFAMRKILSPVMQDDYQRTVPQIAKLHGQFGVLMALALVLQIWSLARQ